MIRLGVFLAALAMAGSAAAAPPLSATLQVPLTKDVQLTAGGVVWNCSATSCAATSTIDQTGMTVDVKDACTDLARYFGPVASIGSLDAAQLAKCNRVARHA
jgi:hypothetical protein